VTRDRGSLVASDESLWRAGASGDQRAFSELYERHAHTIYNDLFRRLAAFVSQRDDNAESGLVRSEISVVNADGSGLQRLTHRGP